MNYSLDLTILWQYREAFGEGLKTTVLLSVYSIVLGTCLAILITLALTSRSPAVRVPANLFVHTTRAIPLLVLLLGAYYIVPALLKAQASSFTTAWIVFSIYLSAFVADSLRAAVLAVPRAYSEAGLSIGMTAGQVRRRIIAPEALRRALPALTALYLGLFKYSTLASVISVNELLHTSELIVLQRLRPVEAYLAVALLFIVIVVPAGLLSRWVERRLAVAADPGVTL